MHVRSCELSFVPLDREREIRLTSNSRVDVGDNFFAKSSQFDLNSLLPLQEKFTLVDTITFEKYNSPWNLFNESLISSVKYTSTTRYKQLNK